MHTYISRMNPHATLIMSGFYTEDIAVLRAEAEKLGMELVEQRSKNNWAAIRLIKI